MPRADRRASFPTYRFKVSLRGVRPSIWRKLLVQADITLADLHEVLQIAMGWSDSHLHNFVIDGREFGNPDEVEDSSFDGDERTTRLRDVATVGSRLTYEYDFGDGWTHDIVIDGAVDLPIPTGSAICLGGRRACPPEDCGGTAGYREIFVALRDRNHPRHAELLEWAGGPITPRHSISKT